MRDLSELRQEIDEIDAQMLALFERRMAVCREVGAYKIAHGLPVLDAGREAQVLAARVAKLEDVSLAPQASAFFECIMAQSRALQRLDMRKASPRVAWQGVQHAYAAQAAAVYFGEAAQMLPQARFDDVLDIVARGEADFGVLPVENTLTGGVTEVYDLLEGAKCHVVGEVCLPIRHCLLGLPGADLSDIRQVISHPQALRQCQRFLKAHAWQKVDGENTAMAAQRVRTFGDMSMAAIASEQAGIENGLCVLQRDIQDQADNTTRFWVIAPEDAPDECAGKATLTFTLRHVHGSLYGALEVLTRHGLNLLHIVSRPVPGMQWVYRFYVDVEGVKDRASALAMIEEMRAVSDDCRLLGVYPPGRKADA